MTTDPRDDGDYRCRAVCPWDGAAPPSPTALNTPYGDSACPSSSVCSPNWLTAVRELSICVPPCDPADPSTCLAETVCRYHECVTATLAAGCPDGSSCAAGQICDTLVTPFACVSPAQFDAAHPRPAPTP